MSQDPIIDELHKQRAETMARFNYDFEAYFRHLKEQEKSSPRPVVPPPDPSRKRKERITRPMPR